MAIEFVRKQEKAVFHSPLEDMALVERVIERRRDPLLGHWAIGSPGLAGKKTIFFGPADPDEIERLAEQSRPGCFLCPGRVEQATPRYPADWLAGGRLQRGDCRLFPNLFPIGGIHAVVALGEQHYRRLDDFPAALLADGLGVALDFVRAARRARPAAAWFSVNANYLHPAGASVFHPHLQVLGGVDPASAVERLVTACRAYRAAHGEDYFSALLAEERARGERWIGASGPSRWLTPFAPAGTNEVLALLPDCGGLDALDEAALAGLADGLSRALAGYAALGFSTFNFSLIADALDAAEPACPVLLRLIARQNVYPGYRSDGYFVQRLLGEELMVLTPEEVATSLRRQWAD